MTTHPENLPSRVALTYGGVNMMFDDRRLVSLNQMWEAAGKTEGKEPWRWAETEQAKGFIADLARSSNLANNEIWKSKRGRHLGGTWAHWQVALAYAKYLFHEFHRFGNEAFREWVEEKADPDLKAHRAVEGYRRRGRDDAWIAGRIVGILARNALTDCLKAHRVEGVGIATCTNAINAPDLGGTAKEFKHRLGLPARAKLRDSLRATELAGLRFAEFMAEETIRDEQAFGNVQCASVCHRAGEAVQTAIEAMRAGGDQ
jgi:hypothetical protein